MDVMPFKSVSGKGEVVYFCEDKDISLKESVANPMLPLKVNCLGIRSEYYCVYVKYMPSRYIHVSY